MPRPAVRHHSCMHAPQVLHHQPTGELVLDVRTEQGQQLEGLLAADCCLQVGRGATSAAELSLCCRRRVGSTAAATAAVTGRCAAGRQPLQLAVIRTRARLAVWLPSAE